MAQVRSSRPRELYRQSAFEMNCGVEMSKIVVRCGSVTRWLTCLLALIGLLALPEVSTAQSPDQDDLFKKEATWTWPDLQIIQEQLKSFLDVVNASPAQRAEVEQGWSQLRSLPPGPVVLERLLALLEPLDARLAQVLATLNAAPENTAAELQAYSSQAPAWLQDNLKLAIVQHYCQSSLFDEALQLLDSLNDAGVVDPSSLMFYRAVCYHHFLDRDKCIEQVDRLLERESEVVSRYVVTAKLIKSDLQPYKPETLDEIARLMNDVERRLELGRAGVKVRDKENEIVEKLDKLIDKIEKQLQDQQQQEGDGQGEKQKKPANAMNESQNAGGTGPGDVDPKKQDGNGNWGDLPPAQRQEALQNITRDLPSHYREVIEAYFKRLGTGDR